MAGACSSDAVVRSPTNDRVEVLPDEQTVGKNERGSRKAGRPNAPDFDEIWQRYHLNADDYDRLAYQLEQDLEVIELYCDKHMVVVTTREETFYDGEDDPYTSKYAQLCRFTWKVAARRSANGIRFPHGYFEVGPTVVTNFLEKKSNRAEDYNACNSPLFDGERGACEMAIDGDWFATYEWKPFCLEYMKGEIGC